MDPSFQRVHSRETSFWSLRQSAHSDPQPSESPFPMPDIIWNALFRRGFHSKAQVEQLFSPSLSTLKNPFSILNMERAATRLIQAFQSQESLAIYADFDLDGTSGLALLYEGLCSLGFKNVSYYQPKRLTEGYGLHSHAIEDLAQQGVRVIVSIDVGITAVQAAETARALNIDLIITDHHQPGEILPDCYTIVNPNQKECVSGLSYLCGAGVAFYLLLAVRKLMTQQGIAPAHFNPKDVLDFFIIGTLTDMVPLREDNRVLIKHGLARLSQTQRPGLRKLLNALGFADRILTSQDVAIQVAPKLNALSRMETDYLPRDVLLEKSIEKADQIIEHVLKTQEMRKSYQKTAQLKAFELQGEMAQQGYAWVWSQDFHKGVIGLVATYLCEKLRVPCFVGSLTQEGIIVGSSRLPEGSKYSLVEILNFCTESLEQHGGHVAAAGFKLNAEMALELDAYLAEYFEQNPCEELKKTFTFDSEARLQDLNPPLMNWIQGLEPYGKDFPVFLFCVRGVRISKKKDMNGGHLKFTFTEGPTVLEGVIFSPRQEISQILEGAVCDILVEPQWNYYKGSRKLQLMIKDMKVC